MSIIAAEMPRPARQRRAWIVSIEEIDPPARATVTLGTVTIQDGDISTVTACPKLAALPQVRTMTDDALKYEALGSLPIWSVAQQWAHHCRVPTPALLGAVLAVVSARQSPSLMLTGPPAESPVSLHVTVLGGSGSGKSAALSAAHRALYLPDGETVWSHTCQPSSAEGLIDWLNATEDDADGEPQRVNTRGLVLADELAIFTGRAARQGNPLAPTLRSAWSGHELRADVSRHTNGRRQPVQRGTYQVSMLTFGTWGDAADLAADATGTAARMLWLHATDAQQPDSQPPEPTQRIAPHDWLAALSVHRDTFGRALPITLAAPVAAELDAALVARARGEEVPAAGHEHDGLLRLRIAAILGILSTATPEVTRDALGGRRRTHVLAISNPRPSTRPCNPSRRRESTRPRPHRRRYRRDQRRTPSATSRDTPAPSRNVSRQTLPTPRQHQQEQRCSERTVQPHPATMARHRRNPQQSCQRCAGTRRRTGLDHQSDPRANGCPATHRRPPKCRHPSRL